MTGPETATALLHGAALVGIFTAVAIIALAVCDWIERRDDEREAARNDANAHSLDYWRDTNPDLAAVAEQAWEDHPARRADIAKARREQAGRRDMERIWRNATGGESA